jgi:hypothetical protein
MFVGLIEIDMKLLNLLLNFEKTEELFFRNLKVPLLYLTSLSRNQAYAFGVYSRTFAKSSGGSNGRRGHNTSGTGDRVWISAAQRAAAGIWRARRGRRR